MEAAQFLVSEPYRCVCIAVPKVASTTLLEFFAGLHTADESSPKSVRSALRNPKVRNAWEEAGFLRFTARGREIPETVNRYSGFFFFCFVRNPYSRLVSSYCDKLNRYARAFDRSAYFLGKAGQLTALHRGAAESHRRAVNWMKFRISFPRLVHGLARNGVDFDPHFRRQSDIAVPEIVPYDYVGKLETFEQDLAEIKARLGLVQSGFERAEPVAARNTTGASARWESYYTDSLKSIVRNLYRADFDHFGYH